MKYHLTRISRNQKLGPMPAATSSRSTCPTSCPLMGQGGCYAEYGPMSLHWSKVDQGGLDFDAFIKEVEKLPRKQLWRYGQAGDLPGEGDVIDRDQALRLAKANRNRPVIAFTHKPATAENLDILDKCRDLGFPVNLSANNLNHADELLTHGHNVVVVLPIEYQKKTTETQSDYRKRLKQLPTHTDRGTRIAVCPATYTDTNCLNCGACATKDRRSAVIGFPAHGTKRKTVSAMAIEKGKYSDDITAFSG